MQILFALCVPSVVNFVYEKQNLIIYSNTVDGKSIGEKMCISQQPGANPYQQKSILQALLLPYRPKT